MIDCTYSPEGPPWRCTRPGCGHEQSVSRDLHRNCLKSASVGLGDSIAKLTIWLGIRRQCRGCQRRQATLNRWVPYEAVLRWLLARRRWLNRYGRYWWRGRVEPCERMAEHEIPQTTMDSS